MNGEYIRAMSDEELTKRVEDFLVDHPNIKTVGKLIPLVKERIKKLSDFIPLTNFVFTKPEYDLELFKKVKIEDVKEIVGKIGEALEGFEKPWNAEKFEQTFRTMAEENQIKVGDMFQLLRIIFAGQLVTPPLFETLQIMGEDESLARVKEAEKFLS
jgi:glutamyl-tRNA synthetase